MKKPASLQESWIAEYIHGTASPEAVKSLERALKDDAALRAYFLEYLNIDLALSAEAACASNIHSDGAPKNVIALPKPPGLTGWRDWASWSQLAELGKIAAAVGLLALAGT